MASQAVERYPPGTAEVDLDSRSEQCSGEVWYRCRRAFVLSLRKISLVRRSYRGILNLQGASRPNMTTTLFEHELLPESSKGLDPSVM